MDLLKTLAAERKEILKGINRGKKQAQALLKAMHALKVAGAAAGKAYSKSLSSPKRKLSAAARAKISAAQKKRWANHKAK